MNMSLEGCFGFVVIVIDLGVVEGFVVLDDVGIIFMSLLGIGFIVCRWERVFFISFGCRMSCLFSY